MEDPSDTADPLSILLILQNIIEAPLLLYTIQSLLIVILLLLTGFLSSLELSFSSLTTENVNFIKNSKDFVDRRINYINLNYKQALTSLRILKSTLGVFIVSLSSYFIWENTKEAYHPTNLFGLIAGLTIVLFFFNEVFPRMLVKDAYLEYSRKTSFALFIIFKIIQPLYKLLGKISPPKKTKKTSSVTPNTVDSLSGKSDQSEEIEEAEDEESHPNVSLEYTTIKQIMVNRLDILALDYSLTYDEVLTEVNHHGFSRIPVYRDSIDSIEGILYVKDLLIHLERKTDFNWHNLIRPGFFVPESKKVEDLLKEFQEKKVHMAIVVDEYGGTSGLVTLEDIIEEIVGEINDEFDNNEASNFSKLDETTYIFEGATPLTEFGKIYNIETIEIVDVKLKKDSLGEFLLELFGRLPSIGEQITFNNFEFTVISVEKEKINRVKVFIKDQTSKEGQLVGR